jgi:hypothetical protein
VTRQGRAATSGETGETIATSLFDQASGPAMKIALRRRPAALDNAAFAPGTLASCTAGCARLP